MSSQLALKEDTLQFQLAPRKQKEKMSDRLSKYSGSCHCGLVKFEVLASRNLSVIECCCSICAKKQHRYFLVSSTHFKLLTGHTVMTTYSYGAHQSKYMFCEKCGVQPFFIPGANPDRIAVMPHCLDSPQPAKINLERIHCTSTG